MKPTGREVLRDPQSVWDEGSGLVMRGLLLMAWVLHEKRLQGKDGANDAATYDAMTELYMLARDFRNDIIRYAENGSRLACCTIFREGKAMVNTFSRLALTSPELFLGAHGTFTHHALLAGAEHVLHLRCGRDRAGGASGGATSCQQHP